MKNQSIIRMISLIVIILCTSCNNSKNTEGEDASEGEEGPETHEEIVEDDPQNNLRLIAEGESMISGKIVDISDAGEYGLYNVTVEYGESLEKVGFNFWTEKSSVYDLKNQSPIIYYRTEIENDLMDIYVEGASIYDRSLAREQPNLKIITGTLSGAENESGDSSDMITVTDSTSVEKMLGLFITAKEIALNGKVITAYYRSKEIRNITYIEGFD